MTERELGSLYIRSIAISRVSQGLKPDSFCANCGTTKVVPCYKAPGQSSFSTAFGMSKLQLNN